MLLLQKAFAPRLGFLYIPNQKHAGISRRRSRKIKQEYAEGIGRKAGLVYNDVSRKRPNTSIT